ncbi:hypothetical protein DJ84_18210 [Halorubrum ezzemoulense]|nr:hypothetical protein DJ84_18210 [Halorubrum ezzemoulense]
MSANTDEPTADGPSTDHDRVAQLEQRLEGALDRIDDLEATVADQEETIDEQADRIEELERDLENHITPRLEGMSGQLSTVRELLASDGVLGVDEYEEFVEDNGGVLDQFIEPNTGVLGNIHDEIAEERDKRGQEIAMVRRRIGAVADEADVEVDNADLMGDDKIRRAIRDGADAVENSVYSSHRRAVELLRNINDVGSRTTDKMGPRFTVDTPSAKQFFRTRNDEKLKSSQIKRVFEKIEQWGDDSPRQVDAKFGGSTNKLVIYLETEDPRR